MKIIGLNINIKMVVESLKIKNESYNFWNDIIYLDDFDVKLVKVVQSKNQELTLIFVILGML